MPRRLSEEALGEGQYLFSADALRWLGESASLWVSSVWGKLVAIFAMSLGVACFPHEPLANDLDSSWAAILGYAHEAGLQFGKDVVFTYGPLGFLISPYFSPYAYQLRWLVDVLLTFTISAIVCLWLWRLDVRWRSLGMVLFALLVANIRFGVQDLLIQVGFLAVGLSCFMASGRQLTAYISAALALGVFAALAKFTFLFTAGITLGAISIDLVLRNKQKLAICVGAGFVLGLVGGWMAAGQNLAVLVQFLESGWEVSAGYQQTMALDVRMPVLIGALVSALLALIIIVFRSGFVFEPDTIRARLRRGTLVVWLGALLFLIWKHGFVRADPHHVTFFLGFTVVLAFFIEGLPGGGLASRKWSRGACGLCCLSSVLALQMVLYPDYIHLDRTLTRVVQNAWALFQPAEYWRKMNREFAAVEQAAKLPNISRVVRHSRIDVFGNHQCYAVFNGFNFHPRPCLQSYAAYSPGLAQMNESFYASSAAPEFVLLGLAPIDYHFAPLEDSLVFRDLLVNYNFVQAEGPFLLLKSSSRSRPKLDLLREGTVRPGQKLDLSGFQDSNIWLQLEVEPRIMGRVRQFLFKPPQIHLTVWRGANANPAKEEFSAPAPLLRAGFVASPLLSTTDDVYAFYGGQVLARPSAYSVDLAQSGTVYWQSDIRFRVYRIDNPLPAPKPIVGAAGN